MSPSLHVYPAAYPPRSQAAYPSQSILRWDLHKDVIAATRKARKSAKTDPLRVAPPQTPPDPLTWSHNLTRLIIDVLAGRTELTGLRRWIEPPLYRRLEARIKAEVPPVASSIPARIRCVRMCKITPSIAEVSLVVEEQEKCRAVALRLEAFRGRWMITALEIG